LLPLLLLLSVYLLLTGHNDPGGGFVGGLVASAAFSLYAIAQGVGEARRILRVEPRVLIVIGLLTAMASGCIGLLVGRPFLTGIWGKIGLAVFGKPGTPVLFDVGVYLTVIGVTLMIIFSLAED
jgi:multicomponent Na+:H+ antiporter subunit B